MDRLDSRPQVSGMMTARKPYPSDVSDEEWALAVPYLTLLPETAGQRTHLLREAFDGLRYVVRHGIPWRAMPHDLPPWHAVYDQAMRWPRAGCFEMLAHDLRAGLRLTAGRREEPSAAILDSRTLRSTPESGARGMGRARAHARLQAAPGCGHARPPARAPRHRRQRERPRGGGRAGRGRPGRHRRERHAGLRRPGLHWRAARPGPPGGPPCPRGGPPPPPRTGDPPPSPPGGGWAVP